MYTDPTLQIGRKRRPFKLACGIIGCLIAVVVIPLALIISCQPGMWLMEMINTAIMNEETFPVPGDAERFEPFAALDGIRERVGADARLVSITISFVDSNGRVDLSADYKPPPRVEYTFVRTPKNPPEEMPPLGAGRGPDDVWIERVKVECYRPGQVRHVVSRGGDINKEYRFKNKGMVITKGSPTIGKLPGGIGEPKLSIESMWAAAIERGAPREAVAVIDVDEDGYRFRINGWDGTLRWKLDGEPR